jgi:hypothetical protein
VREELDVTRKDIVHNRPLVRRRLDAGDLHPPFLIDVLVLQLGDGIDRLPRRTESDGALGVKVLEEAREALLVEENQHVVGRHPNRREVASFNNLVVSRVHCGARKQAAVRVSE